MRGNAAQMQHMHISCTSHSCLLCTRGNHGQDKTSMRVVTHGYTWIHMAHRRCRCLQEMAVYVVLDPVGPSRLWTRAFAARRNLPGARVSGHQPRSASSVLSWRENTTGDTPSCCILLLHLVPLGLLMNCSQQMCKKQQDTSESKVHLVMT